MRSYGSYDEMIAGEISEMNEQDERDAMEDKLRQAKQDFRALVESIGSIERELGIETDGEDGVEPVFNAVRDLISQNGCLMGLLKDSEEREEMLKQSIRHIMPMAWSWAITYKLKHNLDELRPIHEAWLKDAEDALEKTRNAKTK